MSCTDVTGHPEDHHTLQVVVVFVQLKHVQTLDVKSEQSQKQKPTAPCNHPQKSLVCMKKNTIFRLFHWRWQCCFTVWHAECQHICHKSQSEQSPQTMSRTTKGLFPFNSKTLPSSIPFLKMTLFTIICSVTCEKKGGGKLTLSCLLLIHLLGSRFV